MEENKENEARLFSVKPSKGQEAMAKFETWETSSEHENTPSFIAL